MEKVTEDSASRNWVAGLPLRSTRVVIRRFRDSDIEPFSAFMTDGSSTTYLPFDEALCSHNGARTLIERTIDAYDSDTPMLAFAVGNSETGDFVGFCGLTHHGPNIIEVMYSVMPAARNQGYATEIAALLRHEALDTHGYDGVVAFIHPLNDSSRVVAVRAGFQDAGLVRNENFADEVHKFVAQRH